MPMIILRLLHQPIPAPKRPPPLLVSPFLLLLLLLPGPQPRRITPPIHLLPIAGVIPLLRERLGADGDIALDPIVDVDDMRAEGVGATPAGTAPAAVVVVVVVVDALIGVGVGAG